MYSDISKLWKDRGEAAAVALKEIGAIHGRLFEGIKDQQLDVLELWRETTVIGTRLVADAKDYKALYDSFPPLLKRYQAELLSITGGTRELLTQWNTEVSGWFGKEISAFQKAWAPVPA